MLRRSFGLFAHHPARTYSIGSQKHIRLQKELQEKCKIYRDLKNKTLAASELPHSIDKHDEYDTPDTRPFNTNTIRNIQQTLINNRRLITNEMLALITEIRAECAKPEVDNKKLRK